MRTLASERQTEPNSGCAINAAMLRQWSTPEIIMVVTDLLDEESIQFHAIQQARRSGAKVILVQVDRQYSIAIPRTHHLHGALSSTRSNDVSGDTAERMVRYLRWSGIDCEPMVVKSVQANEIPSIASLCGADRVLVSAPVNQSDTLAYEIIDRAQIPVCVVSRALSLVSRYQRPSRRVALVLSLHGKNEMPIAFASRFANRNHSQLTIMHIFHSGSQNHHKNGQMMARFVSHLPSTALRKAEMICPVEIVVREGDPGSEILKYDTCINQDFVILAPPRNAGPIGFGMSAVRTVIEQARCPVFVLTEQP